MSDTPTGCYILAFTPFALCALWALWSTITTLIWAIRETLAEYRNAKP